MSYAFRNYRPADLNSYLQLTIEVEKLEPAGRYPPTQVLRERLYRPNYSPEQDLFIVEAEQSIVGYMDVTPEMGIGRVILGCLIHPGHRRRGLASELLNYATRRAKEMGAKVAHVNVAQDNEVAKSVLSRLGFGFIRRFLKLRLDMAELCRQDTGQSDLVCRHLEIGEENKLTQIQNRCFVGSWGYNPNTVEEVIYSVNLGNCSVEDVILACEGDEAVGYCWTRLPYPVTGEEKRRGQIFMLGVAPEYRGSGFGKVILLAGLSYLQSKGIEVAELTVDSTNETACALYYSIGFKVWASILWYEKIIG
jgi:mycothiol synthase